MNQKLLIVGFVWPEPRSSAAGSRMMQLIYTFLSANYQITFATACSKTDNAFNLDSLGVQTTEIELNHSSFDVFVKNLNPNVVLFDRFMTEEQFGWRVAEQCPDALRILDTEDLHCLRKGRHQAFKDNKPFDINYLFNDTAKREIASIYRCDLSLIISDVELELLKNKFKVDENLLLYLPFLLDPISDDEIKQLPSYTQRKHFITIGNFLHQPNYQSVLYLKQTIWPLIKSELKDVEMHVYGAYSNQKVNQLHNKKEGFLIKGFAPNVQDVMKQSKVCLAPLQFGAGLKGKLVDAMCNGTPCVTTNIGAEGMFGNYNSNGFIEDNPKDFAQKTIELYTDQVLWEEKQKQGFIIINNKFDKTLFKSIFLKNIEDKLQTISSHRTRNFVGSMLMHHTLQSSKYLSKWIEEKNSKTTG